MKAEIWKDEGEWYVVVDDDVVANCSVGGDPDDAKKWANRIVDALNKREADEG